MINKELLSRSKGQIALLKVQLKLYEKNLVAAIPTNNEIFYDIIIDNPRNSKEMVRAQIKFCNRKKGTNLELRLDNSANHKTFEPPNAVVVSVLPLTSEFVTS